MTKTTRKNNSLTLTQQLRVCEFIKLNKAQLDGKTRQQQADHITLLLNIPLSPSNVVACIKATGVEIKPSRAAAKPNDITIQELIKKVEKLDEIVCDQGDQIEILKEQVKKISLAMNVRYG